MSERAEIFPVQRFFGPVSKEDAEVISDLLCDDYKGRLFSDLVDYFSGEIEGRELLSRLQVLAEHFDEMNRLDRKDAYVERDEHEDGGIGA